MSETARLIGAGALGALWLGVVAVNAVYLYGRVRDGTQAGPSTLPVVGSLFGVAALLLAPFGTWQVRLVLLPLALLPDLAPLAVDRLIAWRYRPGTRRGNRMLCAKALKSVEGRIPPAVFTEADGFINRHAEWGVGLEYLIDYLCEEDIAITASQFRTIRDAMKAMGLGDANRLAFLASQVRPDRP